MGTAPLVDGRAPIHAFYSPRSWIEGNATQQLETVAALPGVKAVAAMPDLHPGKWGPVGCSILADSIHPQLVGSDIGCGMGLFQLDLAVRKLRVDKAAERLHALDGAWDGDLAAALAGAGLAPTPFDASLGTVGGGNHFCELQAIETIVEPEVAGRAGLDQSRAYVLVHSGSRGLGFAILQEHLSSARLRHDASGATALSPQSEAGRAYLARHDLAVRWAALNRRIIAMRAAEAARAECQAVADLGHNLVEAAGAGVLHRKGTAPADRGLVPIPGSRGTLSYLVEPLAASASGGAGVARARRRAQVRPRLHARPHPHRQGGPGGAGPQPLRRGDRLRKSRPDRRGGARGLQEHRPRHRRPCRFRAGAGGGDVPAAGDVQDRQDRRLAASTGSRPVRAGGAAMIRLLFTSGRGPQECRIALAKALAVFAREAETAGLELDLATGRDPDGLGPASAIARIGGDGAAAFAATWVGSILWVARSPVRPHHKRKRWFVGILQLEAPPPGASAGATGIDARQVRFEPLRAGGPGGQHQNKTESAVRAVHVPTGLAVVVRDGTLAAPQQGAGSATPCRASRPGQGARRRRRQPGDPGGPRPTGARPPGAHVRRRGVQATVDQSSIRAAASPNVR